MDLLVFDAAPQPLFEAPNGHTELLVDALNCAPEFLKHPATANGFRSTANGFVEPLFGLSVGELILCDVCTTTLLHHSLLANYHIQYDQTA